MPLVPASGFAHDQYRAEFLLPIVLQLRSEKPTNGLRLIDQARHKSVVTNLKTHIAQLKSALEAIEDEITHLVQENAPLKKKVELMRTVIGIGPVSAMVLLAYLPDIGGLTKGEVARLSGLAPINNDSGKKRGARHVEAGRTAIQRAP